MSDHAFDWDECLLRVRARDDDAERALVARLYPLVIRVVRAHLPAGADPRDLVQDVFLRVFERLDQYRGEAPLEHWVSRVAVSTCLNRLRSARRRPSIAWSDLSEAERGTLEALVAREDGGGCEPEALGLLERLLGHLEPSERMLITLLELEERTVAEVALMTGWNRGVVRIRAFRARRKLRRLCEALERKRR